MNTLHHLIYAAALANAVSTHRRERRVLMVAAIAPDLDGATVWSRELWEAVHHTFGHNVFFAAAAAGCAFALARDGRRLRLAGWAFFCTVFVHYALDLAITATWPMRPLWPLSSFDVNPGNFVADPETLDWWLRVPVQLSLGAIAFVLLVSTWRRHRRTALELVSPRLDDLVAGYLARRLGGAQCAACGAGAGFRCARCNDTLCASHARLRGLEASCSDCRETLTVAPS